MVEGDAVFKESIGYLKSLPTIEPLEWDENLALSAMEHVTDIGPKGLLLYQSSDGTEPEDRISKYGIFNESLGENIDFGPNDAIGVIVSLTLDDGESQRPHRDNLFKSDYHKVGIACGPHKTEFQMCVMDFAYDFSPLDDDVKSNNNILAELNQPIQNFYNDPIVNISAHDNNVNDKVNKNKQNVSAMSGNKNIQMNKNDILNNSKMARNALENVADYSHQSPLVKLSLEPEEFAKEKEKRIKQQQQKEYQPYQSQSQLQAQTQIKSQPKNQIDNQRRDNTNMNMNTNANEMNDFENMAAEMQNVFPQLKLKCKKVEVTTKITYCYEDGSTKEVVQTQMHTFDS